MNVLLLLYAIFVSHSLAQRPTEGGFFSFEPEDVVRTHDTSQVRVHYSIEGPNQTRLTDSNGSGTPDFVEQVGQTAEEVLSFYESLGFLPPITEEEMGLELGGSPAFDFYLVDFGGSADGMFGIDSCDSCRCSGYMVIENDFQGYGYPSLAEAISVLVSHELFHAVQAAYNADQDVWISEGMAVWAEYAFDPEVHDFYAFCGAYLAATGRPIYSPPAGAMNSFSYGTALFFAYMDIQLGRDALVHLQQELQSCEEDVSLDATLLTIESYGAVLSDFWSTFASWNLATGDRAGLLPSYWFAERLFGLEAESEGSIIEEEHRSYPLAASYFLLHHEAGDLVFTIPEDSEGVVFSLYPTQEGKVDSPIEQWDGIGPMSLTWKNLPSGEYWLVGSYPEYAAQSEKLNFCLGAGCATLEDEIDEPATPIREPADCQGCATSSPGGWSILALLVFCRRSTSLSANSLRQK